MANDFDYDRDTVASLERWITHLKLNEVERNFAEQHAANCLQTVAMDYKIKVLATPSLRPVAVPAAMAFALAHGEKWDMAAKEGRPEYAYAEQARQKIDGIVKALALTEDERRFARRIAGECSLDVEAQWNGSPEAVPMRRLAVVAAFALAFQHADNWYRKTRPEKPSN